MGQNSRLSDKADLYRPCTMTCYAPSRLISQKSYSCFQVSRKSEPKVSQRASQDKCSPLSSDPAQVHTNTCSLLSAPWFEDRGEELAPGESWITSGRVLCKYAPSSLSAWTSVSLWKHRHWGRYRHCFPFPPPRVWTIFSANSGKVEASSKLLFHDLGTIDFRLGNFWL